MFEYFLQQARALAIQEKNFELLTSGALDDPRAGKRATKWREPPKKLREKKEKFKLLYQSLEVELKQSADPSADTEATEEVEIGDAENLQIVSRNELSAEVPDSLKHMYPMGNNGRALVLPNQATAEELQVSTQPTEEKINLNEWKEDMPDSAVEDVESLFRGEEEVAQKEAIFNSLNKDYLAQQERKESERLSVEAAVKDREKEEAAQEEGRSRYLKSGRGRKRRRESGEADISEEPTTTEEALLAAVSSRKISRKINYDAMSAIFDEDGSFSTELLEDGIPPSGLREEEVDPVFTMV